ncbi:MAG: DoxX subfamily [Acidobacteriota bacterium]
MSSGQPSSFFQRATLICLRTAIGWHFLYEGYYKLMLPGWSSDGTPLPAWSSAGFLQGSTGPLSGLFHRLIAAGWVGWIDNTVKISLLLIGLSLILGLFTRVGSIGALALLTLFYLSAIPFAGSPQPGSEGTYLIVNKTLIEGLAVLVLLAFDTGRIAGLDLLFADRRERRALRLSRGLASEVIAEDRKPKRTTSDFSLETNSAERKG